MGTFQSFRKAYGALKDSTTVGLAKVNSEFKDLDIAVVKATNHVEVPPKERHVRKIFAATSVLRPQSDIAYCIHALSRRLSKTRNWIVATKVLIVIHRTLREGDPSFKEELLVYSNKGPIFQISNFKDDSSPEAWDCSAWVRSYALYLDERLECYRVLKYDIEAERLTRSTPGASKVHSKTRLLTCNELLVQLSALQQLLLRLMACQPEGAACTTFLIQYALALVLKESFKIYCAINDGIINLVDMFFDMAKHDAVRALYIYKRAGQQAEHLAGFYDFCKRLDIASNFQFPTLTQPPPSFLATMEEYVKEAPPNGSKPKRMDHAKMKESPKKEEENHHQEQKGEQKEEKEAKDDMQEEPPKPEPQPESPPLISTDDLLGLNDVNNPVTTELEESNALALAIVPSGGQNQSSTSGDLMDLDTPKSGWELALVTTPSNNNTTTPAGPPQQAKPGGGFDKLLLDSLYEDESSRRKLQMQNAGYGPSSMAMGVGLYEDESLRRQLQMQNVGYGPSSGMGMGVIQPNNPFQENPFFVPNGITPSTNVHMTTLDQQPFPMWVPPSQDLANQHQHQHRQQQMMMTMHGQHSPLMIPSPSQSMTTMPYQSPPRPQIQYPQQHMTSTTIGMGTGGGTSNPFGDPFSMYPQNTKPQHGNPGLL